MNVQSQINSRVHDHLVNDMQDVIMTPKHKDVLTRHRALLVENLVPTSLFRHLIAMGTLTSSEVHVIRTKLTWEKMNSELLDYVMRKADIAFTNFCTALKTTCQDHLAELLEENNSEGLMTLAHRQAITNSRVELSSDMTADEVFNDLIAEHVLLVSEVDEIKQQSAREVVNECLLDYVVRRSDHAFHVLTSSLDKTGQEHLGHLLRNRYRREECRRKLPPLGLQSKQGRDKTMNDLASSPCQFSANMDDASVYSMECANGHYEQLSPLRTPKRNYDTHVYDAAFSSVPNQPMMTSEPSSVKPVLNIHSPAKVMRDRAEFINQSHCDYRLQKKMNTLSQRQVSVSLHETAFPQNKLTVPETEVSHHKFSPDKTMQMPQPPFTSRGAHQSYVNSSISTSEQLNLPMSFSNKPNITPAAESHLPSSLPEVNAAAESETCTLDDVSQQIVLMAENAYLNIQRADNSDESFRQFSKEMAQTTQNINKSLEVFGMIREFCGDCKDVPVNVASTDV